MAIATCLSAGNKKNQRPNIIYMLADDAGYGDFSCYGQTAFQTPNIDKLAEQGMKFTQHYSGSTVCAPSRSTLLTGLHTGHSPIRGNKELDGEGQTPVPAEYVTLAEILKDKGYATGVFGKWGLGYPGSEGDANMQGFDEFYGYNCQRLAHRYYPPYLNHNQDKVDLPGNDWTKAITYAPDLIQDQTIQFIEDNAKKPFFAYVPFIMPHAELIAPDDSILQSFKGKFEETPYRVEDGYASDYGPDIIPKKYCSQEYPKATFAAMMVRMDFYVGQIVEKLEELGITDNTIIMFASDNGPHGAGGADPANFNSAAGFKGMKRDLYEGGIRTAFIVKWPAKIKAGSNSDHVSAFWDVLPTCAEVVGAEVKSETDGISFLPELLGKKGQKQHEYLYWEFNNKGGKKAVRMGDWKGVIYKLNKGNAKLELYNLATDKEEKNNVAKQHPEVVDQILQIMKEAHVDNELFPI